MKPVLAAVSFFVAFATMSPASAQDTQSASAPSVESALQTRLQQLQSEQPDVPGFAVALLLDGQMFTAATGTASPDGQDMLATTPVRIASITKTFVAAAILRLHEQGSLDIDRPISGLIAQDHNELLRADGYDTDAITVRHLLMHASGINDHFGTDDFRQMVLAQPQKVWTRTEQLEVMTTITEPVGPPGEQFHYSDTGYLLLGEIIERTTGQSLADAVHELNRFEELQLNSMRWEGEPTLHPAPARAHQWLSGIDTYAIDGSVDAFGGGGLIGSVIDISRYFDALARGVIFTEPDTLTLMLEAPMHPAGSPYRMGVFTREIGGAIAYSHGGFWGLDAVNIPERNLSIAGVALDQSGTAALREVMHEIMSTELADTER